MGVDEAQEELRRARLSPVARTFVVAHGPTLTLPYPHTPLRPYSHTLAPQRSISHRRVGNQQRVRRSESTSHSSQIPDFRFQRGQERARRRMAALTHGRGNPPSEAGDPARRGHPAAALLRITRHGSRVTSSCRSGVLCQGGTALVINCNRAGKRLDSPSRQSYAEDGERAARCLLGLP
jgi:hypothetical protein